MYENGKGVSKDYETAVKWYKLAAEQGSPNAQYNLGLMYHNGKGVTQNDKTAARWYKLSARQGLPLAQGNLGGHYAFGTGISKNFVEAYKWGTIADTNGNKNGAKVKEFVAKQMTPAQIAEAQKLARECMKNNYKGC